MAFGRVLVDTVGKSIQVTADGRPEMKQGACQVDWSTVAAVTGADVTLEDGVIVKIGEKYLRYGQVLCLIGVQEVQTITFTGGPTAGQAVITLPAAGDQPAQTAVGVDFNASAVLMQAALTALSRIGPNGVTVTRTGTGVAGDPYIYTVTFLREKGNVPQFTSTHNFTGGTTPTTTHATTTSGTTGGGLYGPYDFAAVDGRQTPTRDAIFICNETVKELDLKGDYPPALDGGRVFKDRILATNGTHSLAAGPTYAELVAVMPRLKLVID